MPVEMRPAQIDFSALANLGQIPERLRMRGLRNKFASGGITDYNSMVQALGAVDPIAAAKLWGISENNAGSNVYGTPIYGQDEEGNPTVGVIPKAGGGVQWLDTGGHKVTPGVTFQNLGTSVQPFSTKTGQAVANPTPIDVSGEAAQKEEGKGLGENIALYKSMTSKLPGLYQTVQKLEGLSDKATYTTAGKAYDFARKEFGAQPRAGAVARTEYMSIVDNQILPLLRDTFGAQFTEREGASLRATLGNPDATPQEKQAVLRSFIEQKVRDIQALALQTGQPTIQTPQVETPDESGTTIPRTAEENQEMVAHARAQMASGAWSVDDAIQWLRDNGIDVEDDR